MMNPVWWTPERCAELKVRNPRAYRCDVLGEFIDGAAAAFDSDEVLAAFAKREGEIGGSSQGAIFIDAAGTGMRHELEELRRGQNVVDLRPREPRQPARKPGR